jgi:hypothetical protein
VILFNDILEAKARFWLMTPDAIGAPVEVPDGLSGSVWSPDGATPLFLSIPSGKTAFTRFDPQTGQWTPLPGRPATYRRPKPPFQIVRSHVQVRNGDSRAALVHPLWVVSGRGKAAVHELLCADGGEPRATPQGDAVLYESNGLALFREVTAEPRADYLAKRRAADIETTRENAKQIGQALASYAADYNAFPPNNDSLHDTVDPHIRSGDAWLGPGGADGFHYTFGGGLVAPNARDSTVVGYFPSVGGRFEVYADGHTQWRPGP